MGQVFEFEKEKLIVGVIYNDADIYEKALEMLRSAFGEIDGESERFSFSKEFSDYYDEELGGEGKRVIFSFRDTVDPSRQAEIKKAKRTRSISNPTKTWQKVIRNIIKYALAYLRSAAERLFAIGFAAFLSF